MIQHCQDGATPKSDLERFQIGVVISR